MAPDSVGHNIGDEAGALPTTAMMGKDYVYSNMQLGQKIFREIFPNGAWHHVFMPSLPRRRGRLTGDQRKDLDRIEHGARHLLGLISDILDLARVDAGTIRYERARVLLDPIIREAHAMVAPRVQGKQFSFDYAGVPTS